MLGIDGKAARTAWSYAAVAAVLWAFVVVRKTVLLFVLALIFAYVMYPVMELSQRVFRSRKRMPSMALPLAVIALLLTGTGLLLRGPMKQGKSLMKQIETADFKKQLSLWQPFAMPLGEIIVEQVPNKAMEALPQVSKGLKQVAHEASDALLIPILGFFMLMDGRQICACLMELCFRRGSSHASRGRRVVESIVNDAHVLIRQYVRTLVLLCAAVLLVFSVALDAMKVPYALLLAAMACPLEFVPLAGPVIAGVTIVTVCELNHYRHVMWVVAFLLVYRLFQDYVLSPQLMKKSVQLHPLLVIFGVLAGAEIGGIAGMFLSVPLLALARLVFHEWRKHTTGRLLSGLHRNAPAAQAAAA
jgi:predicted PurR-regulated permease PerM